MDVLALRDNAQYQLQQIKDVETGMEYLNKVRAIEVWARAEKKDAILQNMIAEQKLRTQRILGQLISEGQERGEIRKPNEPTSMYVPDGNIPKTLTDIGISRKESSIFKQIASIPEATFDNFIEEKKAAIDEAVGELTTAGMLAFAKGKPHVSNNSGENEWYTPQKFIDSARIVMGDIDLDPASSEIANKTVQAKTIYTKEDDGLSKDWFGNIWLNPPYSQPLISMFSDAVVEKRNQYTQALVLVNNATETQWLSQMLEICDAVCFPFGRVRFVDIYGNPSGAPLQGQCILYFGENVDEFENEFKKHGICLERM